LDLMFSKTVKVNFKKGTVATLLKGRWCLPCKWVLDLPWQQIQVLTDLAIRANPKLVELDGLRKCFLTGGNSTLRQHCRKHYELYKDKCEKAGIPVNHHAIPPKLAQILDAAAKAESQMTLEDVFKRPEIFKEEATLHAVAQFVACDDQVSW
jgi:hypothetical protein